MLVAGKLVSKTNAEGKEYKTFAHATAKLHTDFAAHLLRMDGEQKNAYFALAAYKQGWHDGPTIDPKTKKPKAQLRVRTNVESLKALWFDIDFKPKKDGTPPKYKTVQEAALGMKAFAPDRVGGLWQRCAPVLAVRSASASGALAEAR